MRGGDGDDTIFAGGGDDVIDPGSGRNRVKGGEGADIFEFNDTASRTLIRDYEPGIDVIDLSGVDFRSGFPPGLTTLGDWFTNLVTLGDAPFGAPSSRPVDWYEDDKGRAVIELGNDFEVVFKNRPLDDIFVDDILIG
jgi:Ca2+-binding RTX toxin-like protein